MMKKTIGFILLALIFTLLIGITCYVFGWKMGMLIWGISLALTLIILIAIYLIEEGEVMNCTDKNCIMQFDKVDPATCKCVSYCPQATPPRTYADKIRFMTDEELAEILHDAGANWYSEEFWLDWLKTEVKESE